jgi:uncharacterized membrane protein
MHPDVLLHAGHFLKEALTGAADEGGGWAWAGLIIGGIVGLVLAFSGDAPLTEEILVLGILLVAFAAVSGAYFGALGKLVYDHFNGKGPSKG